MCKVLVQFSVHNTTAVEHSLRGSAHCNRVLLKNYVTSDYYFVGRQTYHICQLMYVWMMYEGKVFCVMLFVLSEKFVSKINCCIHGLLLLYLMWSLWLHYITNFVNNSWLIIKHNTLAFCKNNGILRACIYY